MSHFVTCVSADFQEECHSGMLDDNMNISHLMVHSQHVEDAMDKRNNRDANRERSSNDGS